MDRAIVHLDADAFFASVEQAADARLRGKPIAVGGEKRGIIASASYEARKFGIYTPMPTVQARRLCPKLILLPGDFAKYELFSRLMFSYAYDFTPDVEIGSIDEGYFDLTGVRKPAVGVAETIRRAIRQSLKLSVSEGIASNKLVSQIASKLKKPSAFQVVGLGNEAEFLSPLENRWLPGVGPKTAGQLTAAGLARIGQIAHTPAELLALLVGSQAPQLKHFARGVDERPVVPVSAPAKSYSEQETFAADTTDEEFLDATLRRMADKLMAKVREDGKSIRTLTVKVRYNDMDEEQASESLAEPTDLETEIYSEVSALLRKGWRRRVSLRLVSLKLSNVYAGRFRGLLALDVSTRQHDAQQRLADVVDDLRQRYGRAVLLRGHDFILALRTGVSPIAKIKVQGSTLMPSSQPPRNPSPEFQRPASATPYKLAVVQRQRLGNSFARTSPSPAPELRFRVSHFGLPSNFSFRISDLKSYIPLNVHSCYSFLDSTLSINAIVDLAQHYQLPAIALTDKNNLHGAVEFAQAATKADIKPIIGAELEWNSHRLCLYVENQKGYRNLCRMLNALGAAGGHSPVGTRFTASHFVLEGPKDNGDAVKRVPTPQNENWCAPSGLSAGNGKLHPRNPHQLAISNSLFDSTDGLLAVSSAAELASFFPKRFYLAIDSLETLEKVSSGLPCVVSSPIHYERPADRWKYDMVQSIRTLTLLRQQHPEKRLEGDYHFHTPTEMQQMFATHPELLAHSREIAERCSFEFSLGKPQFPGFQPPDGLTPAAFLRRLVMEGLQRRYPKEHARVKPQLEEELAIITEVGYEEYFLVMWDILQECRRRGIEWITRGSAADSLACYCLEISGVCPIRFDLYFRRFLNKERMALNKLPDIDVDFPHDRKDDVIDLIFEKYGPANTAIVGGFSTFQARSAFAEVAKVLGVSEYQVRRLTERLPHFSRASELAQAVADTQECRELPFAEEPYRTALQMAYFLEGFPRYPKMHPCGLVLSRQPMDEITPCFISAKGYPTTHFDMDSIEAVGLIKMDILAQGGLAVMRDVQQTVQSPRSKVQSPGPEIQDSRCGVQGSRSNVQATTSTGHTFSNFALQPSFGLPTSDFELPSPMGPWDDPQVWDLIASGQARAVHHIESPAMISLCKMCNVRDIDTLIAIVSVIRPGAANESKKMEFARRYQGLSPVRYPHPSLEACLRSTYGLVVYEEHILQICEAFAGLPPGRADVLRRALAKDKSDIINQIQTEFADCARRRERTESEIHQVWELVAGFKGYAFCKAHSTAYGVEAYQSAWLKRYYPAEFMAAVLTNGKGFYDPLVYILECHRLRIPLLPPSVNEPGPQFTVTSSGNPKAEDRRPKARRLAIRVPILQVKGLTLRTKETILRERERGPFGSLADFFLRVQPLPEEMDSLIRVGAFDDFGQPRTTQYWQFKALSQSGVAGKIQDPRSKLQRNIKHQTPKTTLPGQVRSTGGSQSGKIASPVGAWDLELPWSLGLGAWSFSEDSNNTTSTKNSEDDEHASQLARQLWLLPPGNLDRLPSVPLAQPDRLQRLRAEEELLGYPVSGHPLELFPEIAWETYCPIKRLGEHLGEAIVTCGLVIEQRLFHQVTGEPMKFITIADWTGVAETELFARTYKSYGLNTVRYRVLEITATVEPFENGGGYTLRVLRAGKPRTKQR